MFKALRDKLTSWFKKPEEKTEEKPEVKEEKEEIKEEKPVETIEKRAKSKKEKPIKKPKEEKKTKELKKSKTKQKAKTEEEKEIIKETKQEEVQPLKTQEAKEEIIIEEKPEQIAEEKQGFFKKLFSRKKSESQIQEQVQETPKEIQIQQEQTQVQETKQGKIEQVQKPQQITKEPEEKKGFFAKLASKLSTSTLTQEQFNELFEELQITLLENNVALEVVEKIHDDLSKDLVGIEIKSSQINETIINSLKETILSILTEPPNIIEAINKKLTGPYTIIFVGINGSGKTSSIAKFAHYLKQNKISCVLAAADTFRAAAIEQLQKHAEKLNLPIIRSQYGSDPASVAFDAKKYAEAHKIKAVLIDTAGRMYTKTNLIKEMEKIVRVSNPDLKLFVGESITGNDATEQAKTFNESINIDGIILTKADVDEKAGTILSVSYVTKKPIFFLGSGQSYPDLIPFTKKTILKNLGLEN